MRKFTESKADSIKGWVLLPSNNMRSAKFEIDRHGFVAYLDGDIWDYSEDPYEFCEFIKDGLVYTKVEFKKNKVEYVDPINLKQWIKSNPK